VLEHDFRAIPVDPQDPRVEDYVAAHSEALLYHHPAWLRVLERSYGCEPLLLACEGTKRLRGILPLVRSRGIVTGRRVSSLAHTPVCGPLADSSEAAAALMASAVELVRRHPGTALELRLPSRRFGDGAYGANAVPSEVMYELQLPDDMAPLRFGNARNHGRIKWAVNKATRFGVEVREAKHPEQLRAWYALYVETMRAHARLPIPRRFFEAIWELSPGGSVRLLLAEQAGAHRQLLAGSLFLLYGQTAIYAFNGRRGDRLASRPNELLLWRAIHDAREAGFTRFSFGQVAAGQDGLAQFKAKWGAKECSPHRYVYPPQSAGMGAARGCAAAFERAGAPLMRRLPARLATLAGDAVYRYG
jgi:hypothetical protein